MVGPLGMKGIVIMMGLMLCIAAFAAQEHSIPNLKEKVIKELLNVKKQVALECAIENPVDNATIRQIMTHSGIPDEKEVKCWLSCVLRNMGIINNGKIDWKKGAELSKMVLQSEEDKATVDRIAELCEKEVPQEEKDECQLAYNSAICKFGYGKKLGLPGGIWDD